MLLTIIAFLVALGILIAVHEWGHYRMAVACGVKVLRFSIGMGKPLWRYQKTPNDTEFVIAALPFGGYVRMLDEREAPVAPEQRHLAFNAQPLSRRAAIVASGPAANLVLAVLLYAAVNWWGVQEPEARLSVPVAGSVAAQAGIQGGELVQGAAQGDTDWKPVRSYEDLRWHVLQALLDQQPLRLQLQSAEGASRQVALEWGAHALTEPDPQMMGRLGLAGPWTEAVLGELTPNGAAARSGLLPGDRVLSVNGQPIQDGANLRQRIRSLVSQEGQAQRSVWLVRRNGAELQLEVTPEVVIQGNQQIGRVGAVVGRPPEFVTVRYGLWEGLQMGAQRTWDVSVMSLRMIGRMIVGDASLKNLSGPLTIADYAGRTASLGLVQYLSFLALISVSLGVLNLLPLPVLDGGHLMYYLWEGVTGKSVSALWMERLQRFGVVVLMLMMSVALFNDFSRIIG